MAHLVGPYAKDRVRTLGVQHFPEVHVERTESEPELGDPGSVLLCIADGHPFYVVL